MMLRYLSSSTSIVLLSLLTLEMVNFGKESAKVFLDLGIFITSTLSNFFIKLQTFWWYRIILALLTMQSPLVWFMTNYELLNTLGLLAPTSLASLSLVIRASYSTSLLEALNLKQNTLVVNSAIRVLLESIMCHIQEGWRSRLHVAPNKWRLLPLELLDGVCIL